MPLGTMLLGTLPASGQWWLPDDRTMMRIIVEVARR
jgi:hypothetical protein